MTTAEYTTPSSPTRYFVASAIWAAVIIPLAWLSSTFLSIPGAFGAGYFWLPQMAMPTGAYFLGPWGWLAAAVGTFFGGMLSGSPLLINIAQNPVPAFLANALLFWLLLKLFQVKVGEGYSGRIKRNIGRVAAIVVGTIVVAVVAGFFIGKATEALGISSRWGYVVVFLLTIPTWYLLGVPLNRHVVGALVAIIISSVISAVMGAYAWATIGEMGPSAWTIVFPGWALGDIVAGSLAVPLIWTIADEMTRRGLNWDKRSS
ncbi:MAG: hypothetical protein H6667_25930 [Ardenticatenaceae bacterium]|nr:hypothetical protein [Ardenticatenaceae bacterium]MCB9445504.1 hypothetical protein [Ardenticatenaceae bacterium]